MVVSHGVSYCKYLEAVMEAEEEYYVGPRSPDNDEMEAALAADAWWCYFVLSEYTVLWTRVA